MTTFCNVLQATALAGVVTLASQTIALAQEDAAPRTLVNCAGGALENTVIRTQNSSTSLGTAAGIQPLVNSQTSAGGSGNNPDTYIITLSGEADNSVAAGFFTVQGQIRVNGGAWTDIHPNGPTTFHTGTNDSSASMTWCTRVEADNAQLRVVWDSAGAGNTSTLDDYMVMVQRLD